ncbi:hypothetical protein B0H12DRAFT_1147366 [Mycena haematopus]|nr:hypothetical protein B0H12DRAFT_1147366 [Mycena haematopus]
MEMRMTDFSSGGVSGIQDTTCDTFGGSSLQVPSDAAPASLYKSPRLSGGGFSNVFPVVEYRDVALQEMNVEFVREGTLWLDDGTNFATPIFAALVALNDRCDVHLFFRSPNPPSHSQA